MGNLSNNRAREIHILRRRHDKHRLYVAVEAVVRRSHLELVFEVGDGPQALDNDVRVDFFREVNEQVVERHNRNVVHACRSLASEGDTFFDGEQRALLRRVGDSHHDFVEHLGCAAYDIKMTVGNGIERSRNQGFPHS